MIKKRITKTTIEAHEVYILKLPRKLGQVRCRQCENGVVMLRLDEAVRLTGASSRAIHRLIEAGEIHFAATPEGLTLVCPASLLHHVPSPET